MQSGNNEKLCLKWNKFQDNVRSSFEELREDKNFTDVTLACEDGQQVDSHKMVLITSSPFFSNLLRKNQHTHPLIYMRGIKFEVLLAMVDFFYCGEAKVYQENLDSFLLLATELQLKGLEDNQNNANAEANPIKKMIRDKLPNQSKRVKPKDIAENEYLDGDKNWFEPISKETRIALSDQANYTDLENLDETVKSMMVTSENRIAIGKQFGRKRICTACGKEGHVSSIMNHIESIHLTGLQIPCNICGKTVKSRQSLAMHKVETHRKKKDISACNDTIIIA